MTDGSEHHLVDQIIGNYRIIAPIGTGGMGRVYRAHHLHLERAVAIKLLHAHLAADETFRARFRQEAQAVSRLEHPHIVRLYDYGEQDGHLYLIMELLGGGSLRALLRGRAAPTPIESLRVPLELVRQAAEGLAYAHALGMVHRDIKPDNLLLEGLAQPNGTDQFRVKIGDFGLARLADASNMTASGVTLGTPAYMSPEQCQGRDIDPRSDIYSLGIVVYEVATGRVPFTAKSLSDAIYNHVYVAPPPLRSLRPDLPTDLEAIILRCLAKRPDDRYQTMEEFAAALAPLLTTSDERPVAVNDVPAVGVRGSDPQASPALTVVRSEALRHPSNEELRSPVGPPGGALVPRVYVFGVDGGLQQLVDLTGQGMTVGRLVDNDLVLNDPGVSRHHLLIDWNGSRASVTDLGSGNGTVLAGVTLPPRVTQPWNAGDELSIGRLRLRLVLPEVSVPVSPMVTPISPVRALDQQHADNAAPAPVPLPATSAAAPPSRRGRTGVFAVVVVTLLAVLGAFLLTRGSNDDPQAPGVLASPSLGIGATPENQAPTSAPGVTPTLATTPAPSATPSQPGSGLVSTEAPEPTESVAVAVEPPCPESPEGVYLYVADQLNDRIQKFDGQGNVICQWTGDYVGEDDIARPGLIAVDSQNNLYVSNGGWIKIFDARGRYQGRWGDGEVWPWDMAFDREDNLYIVDGGLGKVFAYTAGGELIAEWGSPGSGDGQMASANGIAVDVEGNVYICDRNNHRVQKFDSDGTLLAVWQPKDEAGFNSLNFPGGIAVDADGFVYVAVIRVAKLDQSGAIVATFGDPEDFAATGGLEVAADGTLYAIETINQHINYGTTAGELLGSWGGAGSEPGQFNGLADIAASTR